MARTYAALPYEYGREMRLLSDAEFGRLCRALIAYSEAGKPIALSGNERFYAERVMAQEDRVQQSYEETIARNRENGKKGGRPRKNPPEPTITQKTESKPESKPKNKPELNSPPAIAGGREGDESPAPMPRRYGSFDNVILSEGELAVLRSSFPDDWQEKIERLSSYMASSGKGYQNHLATIQRWADRERKEAPAKPPEQAPQKSSGRRRWSALAAEMEAEIGGRS